MSEKKQKIGQSSELEEGVGWRRGERYRERKRVRNE